MKIGSSKTSVSILCTTAFLDLNSVDWPVIYSTGASVSRTELISKGLQCYAWRCWYGDGGVGLRSSDSLQLQTRPFHMCSATLDKSVLYIRVSPFTKQYKSLSVKVGEVLKLGGWLRQALQSLALQVASLVIQTSPLQSLTGDRNTFDNATLGRGFIRLQRVRIP